MVRQRQHCYQEAHVGGLLEHVQSRGAATQQVDQAKRTFSDRMTTMVKMTYSGFQGRRDGTSWLSHTMPTRLAEQPNQYFAANWNRRPRLR